MKKAHSDLESHKPIAIIGIGCRFPGGVHDPRSFWKLLSEGVDAVQEIPPGRIDIDRYYDPKPGTPGKMATRWGGFLEGIDTFDAAFFGISPREAERMDPQQRLLLEIAWEALEDAGLAETQVRGSQAGVFIGVWLNDFEARLFKDPAQVDFYMTTGSGRYALPGRLSYYLGLQGPSLSVDTACSSSLVAVHLACQSLWNGECSYALAGGVNIILQPHISIAYSQSKMMALDGHCKFGDTRADGYVRSEGAGIIVLKPLSQALTDADPIYALIRGSAVNNDGRSSGFMTTPAIEGQEHLLETAYRNAGVSPGEVAYIEAHGTGTHAGDPVEIQALGRVLIRDRIPGSQCAVGSVKTNLGHTEGAAGVAGLIKTVLALQHRQIPASLHMVELNPEIPWSDLPLYIPTQLTPFPNSSQPLIAGVSSFGIAGTNAHVVIEEPPHYARKSNPENLDWDLLTLSAQTDEALKATAHAYSQFLAEEGSPALRDVCYTARNRRTHHERRLALAVQSRDEATTVLEAFSQGQPSPKLIRAQASLPRHTKIAFVFPGQGSQWLGMGRELMKDQPVFREVLQSFDQAVQTLTNWSLLEQLTLEPGDPGYRMDEIGVIQPVLLAIEIGLAELWRSWGFEPDAVIGHSLGEVGAAYLAGVLDILETARVICLRSQLLQRIRGQGGMALVGLPASKTQEAIQAYAGRLSISVSNSFSSTVIAGDLEALNQVTAEMQAHDVFCRQVKVDVAAHSPQVEPLLVELEAGLSELHPKSARIPFYSTAAGQVKPGNSLDAHYWGLNLRSPVRFAEMTEKLLEDGFTLFIELSPHPILVAAIEDTIHHLQKDAVAVPSLWRDEPEISSLLRDLSKLHTAGFSINFDRIFPDGGETVRLPNYPWQRKRYWLELADARAEGRPTSTEEDPLLGRRLPELAHLPGHTVWENQVDAHFLKQLRDRLVETGAGIPAALYQKFALTAAEIVVGAKLHTFLETSILSPIHLEEEGERYLQSVFINKDNDNALFHLYSRKKAGLPWQEHGSARIKLGKAPAEWLYQLKWVQKSSTKPLGPFPFNPGERWLIFADREGLGFTLSERLKASQQDCTLVYPEGRPDNLKSGEICVRPHSRQDFIQLLEQNEANGSQPFTKILYLWNLDLAQKETADISSLEASLPLTCEALIYLAQALNGRDQVQSHGLWIVTRDTEPGVPFALSAERQSTGLTSLPDACLQALAWGLGRSLALEVPGLWGGLIDLSSPADHEIEVDQVLEEIIAQEHESGVAYRSGQRFVARLTTVSQHDEINQPLEIHSEATYLVTGGLGSVGLALAGWLASQGAGQVVLTSRVGLPERGRWGEIQPDSSAGKRIQAIQSIEAATGVIIRVARADVADRTQMEALLAELGWDCPPIKGIFHAAGMTSFHPFQEIDSGILAQVLRPKVLGTWVLNELVQDLPLDFFVLFSSGASIWGSKGLADYGAANHYLDCAAHYRTARGLPALSINWGWWEGEGMVSGEMAQLFRRAGLHEMPAAQAIEAMSYLLSVGGSQHIVAAIDWDTFKPLYEANSSQPFLEEILPKGQKPSLPTEAPPSELLHQLSQATDQRRRLLLIQYLRSQVASILGFTTPDSIGVEQGFFKLGMDSMMTMQLRTRLEAVLSCSLPPTLAFEYPSIHTLADYILKEILPQASPPDLPSTTLAIQPRHAEDASQADKHSSQAADKDISPDETASGNKELLDLVDQELSRIDDLLEGT